MKKVFFIFIMLFSSIPCFAANTGPFSAWYDCIDKINSNNSIQKQLAEEFFGKYGNKVPEYVVRDDQGNIVQIEMNDIVNTKIKPITTRSYVINTLFKFMSEHCEEYFVNMMSQAYAPVNNDSVIFDFNYPNDLAVRGKVVPEHAIINIYPKTDVHSYPKFIGFIVSTELFEKGDKVSTSNTKVPSINRNCSNTIDRAGESAFSGIYDGYYRTFLVSSSVFPGLMMVDTKERDNAVLYQETDKKEDIIEKLENFYVKIRDKDTCHRSDDDFRIYAVVMSKKHKVDVIEEIHTQRLDSIGMTYIDVYMGDKKHGSTIYEGTKINNVVVISDRSKGEAYDI